MDRGCRFGDRAGRCLFCGSAKTANLNLPGRTGMEENSGRIPSGGVDEVAKPFHEPDFGHVNPTTRETVSACGRLAAGVFVIDPSGFSLVWAVRTSTGICYLT